MPPEAYVYQVAGVAKVSDGDTWYLHLDLGFHCLPLLAHIRLYGYDCPESAKGSKLERAKAREAKAVAVAFLARPELWVKTHPDPDDFGRWLGELWAETGGERLYLGQHLASLGLATVWPTRWRTVFDKA